MQSEILTESCPQSDFLCLKINARIVWVPRRFFFGGDKERFSYVYQGTKTV